MSSSMTHYVIFGFPVPYDKIDYDEWEDEIEMTSDDRKFDMIYDGMGGDYCYVGKVLVVGDIYEGFEKPIDLLAAMKTYSDADDPFLPTAAEMLGDIRCGELSIHLLTRHS